MSHVWYCPNTAEVSDRKTCQAPFWYDFRYGVEVFQFAARAVSVFTLVTMPRLTMSSYDGFVEMATEQTRPLLAQRASHV